MAWMIGLVGGLILGGAIWGWSGAIVLGFVGWLGGIIVGSRKSSQSVVTKPAKTPIESTAARMERLERSVMALEARLERLEGGAVVTTSLVVAAEEAAKEEVKEGTELDPRLRGDDAVEAGSKLDPRLRGDDIAAAPVAPAKPNPLIAWFTGGNTIVRIGALILFVGLIFLLNYAREHQMIAPEFRVAGVAIVGIALLIVGWKLRHKNTGYAVSLQGAGVAVLYLTIFAAMRLYRLLPPEAAFFLLAAMAVFSAMIAIGQNSLALAVIGAGGGFLAPILASTGSGNHVALFGYYLVLNLGLVAIAWFKAWRVLNVVGLVFTSLIGYLWGERAYRPELFGTTEPFLVAFFLMYVAIAILFARASSPVVGASSPAPPPGESSPALPPGSTGRGSNFALVDGTIVFGTPLAAFALQAGIVKHIEFGLAYSSLAAATLYLILAAILHKRGDRWHLLAESFLALGVVFTTLAIPLALDARWTSAAWALEGAAIVWMGVRQSRTLARAFGMLLQLGAGLAYLYGYSRMPAGPPLFDAPFIGAMLVALAGIWTQRLLSTGGERITKTELSIAPVAFVWGLGWFLFAGHHEIETFLTRPYFLNAHAVFFAATALAFLLLARWRNWPEARWPGLALLPALWVIAVFSFFTQAHAFAAYGWASWTFALAVQVFVLRDADGRDGKADAHDFLHAKTFLLVAFLGAWELHWLAARETARGTAWSVTSVLVVPAILLLIAMSRTADHRWPVLAHPRAYRLHAGLVVLIAMGIWVLYANFTHDGRSDPLAYLPLLNAIDLGHGLVAISFAASVLAWRRAGLDVPASFQGRTGIVIASALAFVWLNGVLLRTIHHWAGIPYRLEPMLKSVLVQTSLSIFWSVIALTLMVFATRTARRPLWRVGAVLMGIVVMKLLLVDLSHIGGIERIVSFIAVGVLMLVIGYFSPVPPRKVEQKVEVPA